MANNTLVGNVVVNLSELITTIDSATKCLAMLFMAIDSRLAFSWWDAAILWRSVKGQSALTFSLFTFVKRDKN